MPRKPKLTAAQKKELKAQKKAEAARLAILKERQDKHDALSREYKFGQFTVKRREKTWKQMLINIALPRMRDDLLFAWHNFERTIDAKDFTISLLMDELAEAQEQYMMNFNTHSTNIDNLLIRFDDRMDDIKLKSNNDLNVLQNQTQKEIECVQNTSADNEEYLKMMLFGLQVAKREQEKLVRGDYLSKIDEDTNKYADIIQRLRADLENKFNNIWNNTKTFLKQYKLQRTERKKLHDSLLLQDQVVKKLCNEQLLKLQTMQDYAKKLKENYISIQETQSQKISNLQNESQYFADVLLTLKIRLERDQALDSKNVTLLTVESNTARTYLENIATKAKKIMELAAICRKYETQEEKILPFPNLGSKDKINHINIHEYRNLTDLQLFWQRVAQVDAIRHSINEEREFLKRENKMIKRKIHDHCQCVECPAPVVNKTNLETSKGITVTDGKFMQDNYKKQG